MVSKSLFSLSVLSFLIAFCGFAQDPVKRVLVEEFTGTWCASCAYGKIYFEHTADLYPNAIPVAIHNGFMVDPMEILEVELYMVEYFGGSPTFLFDRKDFPQNSQNEASVSASNTWEFGLDTLDYYMDQVYNDAPIATVGIAQSYDTTSREITITVTANFITNAQGSFRLNCFITEDEVTGGTEYDQSNHNFSGWTGGPAYLQELIAAPQVIPGYSHEHVLRAMLGNPEGLDASIPLSVSAGDSFSQDFTYIVPADQDPSQISLVGLVQRYGPNKIADREIVNANSQHLNVPGSSTGIASFPTEMALNIYPNPVKETSRIEFYVQSADRYSCTLYNMQGQKVKDIFSENLVPGEYSISMGNIEAAAGTYILQFSDSQYTVGKRLLLIP